MPQHKSPAKRLRSDAVRRDRNRQAKSAVRTAAHKVVTASNPEETGEAYRQFTSTVDKAVKKGVYHRKTAARMKSGLSKHTKPAS
ncbi:MAG: 30S ribosomal protein S20 [Candidatus Eisenbacteria sp.]|nr:30S ribosomal protein S20 [Candidatus Eisenbacteria bacterium]